IDVLAVDAYRDFADFRRLDVVRGDQVEHQSHPGMGQRAARMRLDRHAGERERPRIAELALDRLRIVAAAGCLEKAAACLEYDRRGGEPELRELGGDHAAFA